MTFFELLDGVEWHDVKAVLAQQAPPDMPESLNGYQRVLETLRQLSPGESDMRIVVKETFREGLDTEPFTEVVGRNGQVNREQADFQDFQDSVDAEYANAETEFSLSFEPWERWLGMCIDGGTLDRFTAPQIVAHCLLDMTFYGFEQQRVQEEARALQQRVDDVAAMTEEERRKELIPLEDVIRRIEKRRRDD